MIGGKNYFPSPGRAQGSWSVCLLALLWAPVAALADQPAALTAGDHWRSVQQTGRLRSYKIHVPPQYRPDTPTPVVLALHGLGTNAAMMEEYSGLSAAADRQGFVVVYPNGQGLFTLRFWNSGGIKGALGRNALSDVGFIGLVLDDLATAVNMDSRRVYATGMSNGGMMCYRLASELSDRIAAIAPVAGLMAIERPQPKRPVPVVHFHGLADQIVRVGGAAGDEPGDVRFHSLADTMAAWVEVNHAAQQPEVTRLPDQDGDGDIVIHKAWPANGKNSAPVELYEVEGAGHTWPGRVWHTGATTELFGKSTRDIVANEILWKFFQRFELPKGE